jgi:hypothetical protein
MQKRNESLLGRKPEKASKQKLGLHKRKKKNYFQERTHQKSSNAECQKQALPRIGGHFSLNPNILANTLQMQSLASQFGPLNKNDKPFLS